MKRTLHFLTVLTIFFVISSLVTPVAFARAGKADYYLGLDLYHEKDYEGSARAFQQQLSKTPEDISAQRWYSKALERSRLSREEQLAPKSEEPAKAAPSFDSDYDRGVSLYRDNQYAQAQLAFEKHLKNNPNHVPSRQWLALLDAHRPTVDPKTLLDRPIAKDLAAKSAAQRHAAPAAPPAPLMTRGNPQFGMEQNAMSPAMPATVLKPISFGEKLKSIGIGKTKAEPPASLTPILSPNAPAPPSAATLAEIEKLRQELNLRNEQIRRAIVQTKRAITQTDEAEAINAKLGQEIEALHKREAELSAELDKKKSELASLQSARTQKSAPQTQPAQKINAQAAETEKNLRAEIAQLAAAKNGALEAQKQATEKLDAIVKAKAESDKNLTLVKNDLEKELAQTKVDPAQTTAAAEALAKKEAELLKLRQDSSAAQRQFDIRFGQLERTLETAEARAQSLEQEKKLLQTRVTSIENERASSVKKIETETGAAKTALQNRIQELSEWGRDLRTKLEEKTAAANENEKTLKQALDDRKALADAKAALEQEIKQRNEQINQALEETRIATAINKRREKELAQSTLKLEASSEDLKQAAALLEKAAIEKKNLESSITALEAEKSSLVAVLMNKEAALTAAEREAAEAKSQINGGLKISEAKQKQITDQLHSAEQNLARIAASYQASEDARLDAERRAVENARRGKDVAMRLIAKEKELSSALATEEALRRTIAEFDERLKNDEDDHAALQTARLAAEARAAETKTQAVEFEAQIRSLLNERKSLVARIEKAEADLNESRSNLLASQTQIESIRRQSEETATALEAELATSARKLEIATQARHLSEERADAAQKQLEGTAQALDNSERALNLSNQKYQKAEGARSEAERKLAEVLKNTQGLAGQIQTLRDSKSKILTQIRDREFVLESLQADFTKRADALERRAAQSESALRQVSARYQESEQSRMASEKRLGEIAHERDAIVSEISGLRAQAAALQSDLRRRDAAYREARAELAAVSEDASRERAEAASQLSHLEKVLEESRAQGILLANHLERERSLRKNLESRVAQTELSDTQTRTKIKNLRNQLNNTLPQLQAMNASLDQISVTTEISEGTFDE